jgi:hypothetical protein
MPICKYFAVVGSALLVFLFVTDTYFGDNESNLRFNGSLYESAIYATSVRRNGGYSRASIYARCHACRSR